MVRLILIDGLAASPNKQLQLDLLEALWRDREQVPSENAHNAVDEARVLLHKTMVRDTSSGLGKQERKACWDQYSKDLELIVATLPAGLGRTGQRQSNSS